MKDKLRPCPFCGVEFSQGMEYCYCDNCNYRISPAKLNGYCWEQIDTLKAVMGELVKAINDPMVEIAGPKQRDAIYVAIKKSEELTK